MDVLQAVVTRLQTAVPQLNGDNRCFVSMSPEPEAEQRQNLYATVCPMSGRYDDAVWAGSGVAEELSGVVVTVFSNIKLGRPGDDASSLGASERGLLVVKRAVLKALNAYVLLNANAEQIISRPMKPLGSGHPQFQETDIGSISLNFSTDFVWDLS